MPLDLTLAFLLGAYFFLLVGLRRWLYLALTALTEVIWVFLVYGWARLSLELGDLSLMFWGLGWLFLSAVELGLGLFVFFVLHGLTGLLLL